MDDLRISQYLEAAKDNNDPMPADNIKYSLKNSKAYDVAVQWAKDAMRVVMVQADTLDELEQMWIDFQSMPLKHRRESDWKMMELFGFNNQTSYETQKDMFCRYDIDPRSADSAPSVLPMDIDAEQRIFAVEESELTYDPVHNDSLIEISPTGIDQAEAWEKETGYKMMIPYRGMTADEVDAMWSQFNQMILKHRRVSDWKCQELFGCTNQQMYNHMISTGNVLDDDPIYANANTTPIDLKNLEDHFTEMALPAGYMRQLVVEHESNGALKLALEAAAKKLPNYEEALVQNSVDAMTDIFGDLYNDIETMDAQYNDLPYLTADEMIDAGVFDTQQATEDPAVNDNPQEVIDEEEKKLREWFEAYRFYCAGFPVQMDTTYWIQKVREASFMYQINHSPVLEQKLRRLGWPPEMEFTGRNRMIAANRIQRLREMGVPKTDIIDLTEMDAQELPATLQEAVTKGPLYPIYIVLSEGNSAFSAAIKAYTQSPFSHASIALDHHLNPMYSFAIAKSNSPGGGFVAEDFRDVPKRLGVYAIFVSKKQFDKVAKMIDTFKKKAKDTSYGFLNILTLLFHIPYENDMSMICSQFVDRMLKVADIDITHTNSALVAPNNFRKIAKKNNKIYQMYFGLAKRYNPLRTKRLVDTLLSTHKAKPIKENTFYLSESNLLYGIAANLNNLTTLRELMDHADMITDPHVKNMLETMIMPRLYAQPYCEVKEFPVQFNDDGDLFIRNMRSMDFEKEYTNSHRLLVQYEKAGNMEGMKYELAKMWMMIQMVEAKMYALPAREKSTPTQKSTYYKLEKVRARQINDFKYYMNLVQQVDPQWNFEEYYDSTPFSDAVMKINRPTLKTMDKIIRTSLKSLLY